MIKYYYEKRDPAWACLTAFIMKKRVLIIIGAIILAIGFIGAIPFSSIVTNKASQQEINPTNAHPNLSME
jgi:hypothetical protein